MPEQTTPRKVTPIPDEYRAAIPMLAVRDAADALRFYREAFGATEKVRSVDPETGKIWHSEIALGEAQVMVADSYPGHNQIPDDLGGTPVIIHVFVADVDALFARATASGATLLRPLADQPNGFRNGKLRDPYGHVWLFQTRIADVK